MSVDSTLVIHIQNHIHIIIIALVHRGLLLAHKSRISVYHIMQRYTYLLIIIHVARKYVPYVGDEP